MDVVETSDVVGTHVSRSVLKLVIRRKNSEKLEVPVTFRLDSDEEVSIYEVGAAAACDGFS